jgi:peptidoglycan/xylan/chitin deacetylase (PgdA/CDA1 family)
VASRKLDNAARADGGFSLSGVPVLLYHGIAGGNGESAGEREQRYCVTTDQFRAQLATIRELGLQVITLDELAAEKMSISKPAVAITFDDGLWSDHARALPLLRQAGATAHFFVNTSNVGRPGYMDWQQIVELDRAGMQIGSHGHEHVDHSRPPIPVLVRQMRRSREILEQGLQHSADWFAAPYGLVSRKLFAAAEQSGFRGICTSSCWPARPCSSRVTRVAVYEHTSMSEFRSLVTRAAAPYLLRNLRAAGKFIPKQFLLRVRPSALGVNVLQEQQ